MIFKDMKKVLVQILIITFGALQTYAQSEDTYFLIRSIANEIMFCESSKSIESYSQCLVEVANSVNVTESSVIRGEIENNKIYQVYNIQFFYLELHDKSWIMLKYQDDNCKGWYRLKGYRENDFIHLYQMVFKHYGVGRKAFKESYLEWQEKDELVKRVDFSCLMDATRKRENNVDCMISNTSYLVFENTILSSMDEYSRKYKSDQLLDQYYSYFSNRLYSGSFPVR